MDALLNFLPNLGLRRSFNLDDSNFTCFAEFCGDTLPEVY